MLCAAMLCHDVREAFIGKLAQVVGGRPRKEEER